MTDAEHLPAQPPLPSAYQGGGKRRARPRRSHTVLKVLLSTVLTLAMVSGLSVAFLYRHLNGNLNVVSIDQQLTNRPAKKKFPDAPHQPVNVLVLGSDSRAGQGDKVDNETGGGSDTTILVHLSADRQTAYGVSIPRDSLVTRPDCTAKDGDTIPGGTDQIWNAAFSYGGPACTVEQFEQTTGVRVDNYVVVDFSGFQGMVDAIGGVNVCIPNDIDDQEHGIVLKAGTRKLMGKQALSYVRVRHIGDGSDLSRIKRQQAFVAAMTSQAVSGGVLARPDRLIRFLDSATKSLTTDFTSIKKLAEIGYGFKKIGLGHVRFLTVPVVDSTSQPGRVEWTSDADTLWKKVADDKALGKLRDGSINAGAVPGVGGSASAGSSATSSPSASSSHSPSSSDSPSESTSESTSSPSPSDSSSSSVDADPDELEAAGLCT